MFQNNLELMFLDLNRMLTHSVANGENRFPPTDIIMRSDDEYEIVLAVAGIKRDEINIKEHNGNLTVDSYGIKSENNTVDDEGYPKFIQKGISKRSFERTWKLSDYIVVKGAQLEDGLLTISLKREVPDEKKPKAISIG